jgi:hypothetical protein
VFWPEGSTETQCSADGKDDGQEAWVDDGEGDVALVYYCENHKKVHEERTR